MTMKNFYFVVAMSALVFCMTQNANSQETIYEEAVSVSEYSCDYTDRFYSDWGDNWFIQLGAGVNQPFVERGFGHKADGNFIDRQRMTVAYNFGFGRWMSPFLGFRLNAIGGSLHWNNPTATQPSNGWAKGKHVNLNFELMWDMFNSIGGVSQDRVFSIIPFAGFGGDYMWNIYDSKGNTAAGTNSVGADGVKTSSWTIPVTAGLQFRFRLCEYVDFFAEARMTFYGDNWNLCMYGDPVDVNVAAIGGFNINIGGRGWNVFNDCDYVSQMVSLNNQVNDMRLLLMETESKLAACESQLPCPEVEAVVVEEIVTAPLMTTVAFKIDSAEISASEEVNVYNMAQWLKANPSATITIVGYADKDTGTAAYNMELSKKRANKVADMLVGKYCIDKKRLSIKHEGSNTQPYSTNDWNRIVIFSQP